MLYRNPTQTTRRTDFWLGFIGTFVVNITLLVVSSQRQPNMHQAFQQILVLVNLVALIALAFLRNFVALGMVTAFGIAFGTVVLGGVFFTAGDFVAAGVRDFSGAVITWFFGAAVILVAAALVLRAIHRAIK